MTTTDHRTEAERAISVAPHADDTTAIAAIATAHALLAIRDLLAERLPSREPATDQELVDELVRRGVLREVEAECDDEVENGYCHSDLHWSLDRQEGTRRYVTAWVARRD